MQEGRSTLQHAIIGLPISPPQCVPESQGLWPFITFMNCHLAAAVQPCLQRTPTKHRERESELSVPAPNTAITNLLATCISGTRKYPIGLLHTSCQHRHLEKLSKNKTGNFNSYSHSIWIPFPEWKRYSHEFSVGILTACFCNCCCPPCMLSQINFLFLIHKAGF